MVQKLNLLGFILVGNLCFSVQAAAEDPNEDRQPRQNGRNIEELQAVVLLSSFLSNPYVRAQLSDFIHDVQGLSWVPQMGEQASVSNMYHCILADLLKLKDASAKQQKDIEQVQESNSRQESQFHKLLGYCEQACADRANDSKRLAVIQGMLFECQQRSTEQKDTLETCFATLHQGGELLYEMKESIMQRNRQQEGILKMLQEQKHDFESLRMQSIDLGTRLSKEEQKSEAQIKELKKDRDAQHRQLLMVEGEMATVKGRLEGLQNGRANQPDSSVG